MHTENFKFDIKSACTAATALGLGGSVGQFYLTANGPVKVTNHAGKNPALKVGTKAIIYDTDDGIIGCVEYLKRTRVTYLRRQH